MTNSTRLKNDMATSDKRESADKAKSYSRDRNDALTQEKRFEADKTTNENRIRNDELTMNRRELKDVNKEMAIAISALGLVVFLIITYLISYFFF